jgi:tripeptide aminopeptidase
MSASAQLRIARLAATPAVHRAFHWLHLQQPQVRRWQLEMLRIPAPPFGEAARAAWFLERFHQLGLANAHIDAVGNVLAELPAPTDTVQPATSSCILLSAHLDTVFPAGTPTDPTEVDSRILGPGACDNAAGLSALLALAAALRHAELAPAIPILFAANVGEEGEGDLRGMRHLFNADASPYASSIAAAIALEGGGSSAVVTRALASRRFRVTVTGPGGHSWTDAGAPNPILILARALLALESLPTGSRGGTEALRTTLNIGQISGGTSINSIPESATAWIDLRSTDPAELQTTEEALRESLDHWVLNVPHPSSSVHDGWVPKLQIETIGDRPGGELPIDSPLLATVRAVDRHLNLRTEPGLGSTDANIPLSRGIPAIAIGAGGLGGGIHTLQEWYDPTGRNAALRRILLTLLDTANLARSQAQSQE